MIRRGSSLLLLLLFLLLLLLLLDDIYALSREHNNVEQVLVWGDNVNGSLSPEHLVVTAADGGTLSLRVVMHERVDVGGDVPLLPPNVKEVDIIQAHRHGLVELCAAPLARTLCEHLAPVDGTRVRGVHRKETQEGVQDGRKELAFLLGVEERVLDAPAWLSATPFAPHHPSPRTIWTVDLPDLLPYMNQTPLMAFLSRRLASLGLAMEEVAYVRVSYMPPMQEEDDHAHVFFIIMGKSIQETVSIPVQTTPSLKMTREVVLASPSSVISCYQSLHNNAPLKHSSCSALPRVPFLSVSRLRAQILREVQSGGFLHALFPRPPGSPLHGGFHRHLHSMITLDTSETERPCRVGLLEFLPTGLYVDTYELQRTSVQAVAFGAIDVERPTELSSQHALAIITSPGFLDFDVDLPIHLRYHAAAATAYASSHVRMGSPEMFFTCEKHDPPSVEGWLGSTLHCVTPGFPCLEKEKEKEEGDASVWHPLGQAVWWERDPLLFQVPVARGADAWWVALITLVVTLTGCGVVLLRAYKHTKIA